MKWKILFRNFFGKIKKRIRIIIDITLIIILFCLIIFGIIKMYSIQTSADPIYTSYSTNICGTDISYTFVCTGDGSDCKEFYEAEKLVREFMGEAYKEPEEVNFVEIYSNIEIFGLEQNQKIYIQQNMSKEDTIKTMVHELLHIQNPVGFDLTLDFLTDQNKIVGHNFTEAVVEKITSILTESTPTKRCQLLDQWVDSNVFIDAFRSGNKEILQEYFDDGKLYPFQCGEKNYYVRKYIKFLADFDSWMIGVKT